jgi:hypothetical protein
MLRFAISTLLLAASMQVLPLSDATAQSPNPALLARGGDLPMAPRSAVPLGQPTQQPLLLPSLSGPLVQIPAGTPFQTEQDRTTACVANGAASGIAPGSLGSFTADCGN